MAQHPIENVMTTTMENLKEMIDVNTIVGDAVETSDGKVIIPISRVSFGFAAGGGEYSEANATKDGGGESNGEEGKKLPFAGGSGAGVSVNPIAFLVVGEEKIKLLPVQFQSSVDRIIDLVPQVMDEVQNIFGKKSSNDKTDQTDGTQQ